MTHEINKSVNIIRGLIIFVMLVFVLSGTSCSLFKKRYKKLETEEHVISIDNKTKISLDNKYGDIRLFQNTSDSLLRIKIEKITHVKERDLDKPIQSIKVKVDTSGSVVSINTEYTKTKRFFNISFDDDNKTNFNIHVPGNIKIMIDNNNGDLFLTDISNEVYAELKNGDVKLEKVYGKTKLDIVNGKVKGDLDSTKGLDIEVKNGKVNLNLGESFSAKFKLDVKHGKIKKDDIIFEEEGEGIMTEDENSFEGYLGDSEAEVIIDIVNGKITLSKQ